MITHKGAAEVSEMRENTVRWMVCILFAVALLFFVPAEALPCQASETEILPKEIRTAEELLAVSEDPQGSYILMSDLDMTGIPWIPLDFSGTFDGNGHAVLNLSVSETGKETAIVFDGNVKEYEAQFAGFFGTLRGAEVKNLNLINLRGRVDASEPCLMGGIAGYSDLSTISDCKVTGCLELRAFDRMFGVGGVVGFGTGTIQNCRVDVTLICTDTDANTLDEQFLGGAFATGFMNVLGCEINLDGYCSEFGYVHNGGITGMLRQHPAQNKFGSTIRDNTIAGKITFFECNKNRRAYCHPEVGEILANWYTVTHNKHTFVKDERHEYDVELRPEMCLEPRYTETLVEPGCSTYGYTRYCCDGCGYEYTDHYTLFQHTVSTWTAQEAPTTEQEGRSTGNCDLCGAACERTEPRLEHLPTETEAVTQLPTEPEEKPAETRRKTPWQIWILPAAAVSAGLGIFLLSRRKKPGGAFLKNKGR